MDNRLKLRISRMFRSSFSSCRPRNLSDVVEKAVVAPQNAQTAHLLRPALERPLPSLCRPACPDPARSINPTCIISARRDVSRRRPRRSRILPSTAEHCHYYSPLAPLSGRLCPASSPFYGTGPKQSKTRKKKDKEKEKGKGKGKGKSHKFHQSRPLFISTSSQETNTTCDWFSSDDEREEEDDDEDRGDLGDETETLFSSLSLSSDDSSAAWRRRHRRRRHLGKAGGSRRRTAVDPAESLKYNIKGSLAVVKRSSDPYGDFRTSMVEMIVERQLYGADDLRQLLRCFLALNSSRHHAVIVEVFREIRETLFSPSPPVYWN